MDNKNIIIIISTIVIIGLLFYIVTTHLNKNAYQQGIIDGQIQTAQTIGATYQIPIINNNTIQWIPIGNICGRE